VVGLLIGLTATIPILICAITIGNTRSADNGLERKVIGLKLYALT